MTRRTWWDGFKNSEAMVKVYGLDYWAQAVAETFNGTDFDRGMTDHIDLLIGRRLNIVEYRRLST